jgi:hypothetical protein
MGSPSKMGVYEGHTGAIWAWNGLEYGIPTWVYHTIRAYRFTGKAVISVSTNGIPRWVYHTRSIFQLVSYLYDYRRPRMCLGDLYLTKSNKNLYLTHVISYNLAVSG